MHTDVYRNRPVFQMKPAWAVVFSASAAPVNAVRVDPISLCFGHIQGLQQFRVRSLYTGASSVERGVFMGLALLPDSQIRTTQHGLITANPSAVNDPLRGSGVLITQQ